jgi:hypothetical protein
MLRNQVGISNDLASLLYCRSSAEIITSRTPSAEIITLSAALSGDNREFSRYVFQITVYANAGVAKQYLNRFIITISDYGKFWRIAYRLF